MKRLATVFSLAILASACQAGPEYANGEDPYVDVLHPFDPAENCLAVPGRMTDYLEERLRGGDSLSLRNPRAYRAGNFNRPFFIAAEIDGPGLEGDGQVATWSASALTPSDGFVVMAEDDLAVRFSTLEDARATEHFDRRMFTGQLPFAGDCVRAEASSD